MRILPYCLPVLLTTLFIGLAYFDLTWIFAILLFSLAWINTFWGVFSPEELNRAYDFFHYSPQMSFYKGVNGSVFVLFNVWAAFFCTYHTFDVISFIVFTYGIIVVNSSFGLSLAHELIHEKRGFHRRLGDILMLQNGFFYLSYDHIFIHHTHVGTQDDPASANLDENVYGYLRRSLGGRLYMIFNRSNSTETAGQSRLRKAVRWKLAVCTGWLIGAFFISKLLFLMVAAQYIFVILVYETTTYIQHYGLCRQHREKVRLDHSWNSYDRLYNYLYFFMPVHSLHHANVKPAATDLYAGPAMPLSFPRMLFLAFRPKQWFKTMNPLVRLMQERQRLQREKVYE